MKINCYIPYIVFFSFQRNANKIYPMNVIVTFTFQYQITLVQNHAGITTSDTTTTNWQDKVFSRNIRAEVYVRNFDVIMS